MILRPFPQNDAGKQMWTNYRKDIVNHSGIAIFVFGNKLEEGKLVDSNGMLEEFDIAKEKELLILPIRATGYVAKEIHKQIMDNFQEFYPSEDYRLQELFTKLEMNRRNQKKSLR